MTPSVGRIVHYKLAEGDLPNVRAGEIRPALIVRVNGEGPDATCNLSVLLDGPNDQKLDPLATAYWAGSRREGPDNGEWSWPPRT